MDCIDKLFNIILLWCAMILGFSFFMLGVERWGLWPTVFTTAASIIVLLIIIGACIKDKPNV